jgi:hypothetical protein
MAIQLFLAEVSLFKRGSTDEWSFTPSPFDGKVLAGGQVEWAWQPGLRFHDP